MGSTVPFFCFCFCRLLAVVIRMESESVRCRTSHPDLVIVDQKVSNWEKRIGSSVLFLFFETGGERLTQASLWG